MSEHLLTLITFLPMLGALMLTAFPRGKAPGARGFALFVSGATFVLSLVLAYRIPARPQAVPARPREAD